MIQSVANRPIGQANLARARPAPKQSTVATRPAPARQEEARQPSLLDGVGKFFGDLLGGIFGHAQDDRPNDGKHSQLPFQPKDGSAAEQERATRANSRTSVLFVNGAGADMKESEETAQVVANKMGRNVELIHNATEIQKNEGGLLSPLFDTLGKVGGGAADVNQVADDHFGRGHNPAVDSVKEELVKRLSAGEQVDIVGHSQGNNIVARATRELAQEHPELADRMANLRVINMAGPTRRQDYAPGLRYSHIELPGDFVPRTLGETMSPQDLARREQEYDLKASPLAIGLGFLGQQNNAHDPAAILDDPMQMAQLQMLFAPTLG